MANSNNKNDSNTLFFIVGGLVVLAVVFGFIYMDNGSMKTAAPVSERIVERTNTTTILPGEPTTSTSQNTGSEANETEPAAGQSSPTTTEQ